MAAGPDVEGHGPTLAGLTVSGSKIDPFFFFFFHHGADKPCRWSGEIAPSEPGNETSTRRSRR